MEMATATAMVNQPPNETSRPARLLGWPRHEHRDLAAVRLVPVSVSLDEVTLFELDGDEDVSRRRHGEDQVRDGHRRRRPEGDDETEIDVSAQP